MKRNAFTPVPIAPRISDAHSYTSIHINGLESMLNTDCEWLINTCKSIHQCFYKDTDHAYALYKSKLKDLEFIRIDMTIYSYIMEGWC